MNSLAGVSSSGPWHAAFLYASPGQLGAALAEVMAGDASAVLVVAAKPNLSALRDRLDGRGRRVTWVDMSDLGLNPGRLIPALRVFADEHPDGAVWCVQEPAWPGRSRTELDEVIRHEALVNLAFAGSRVRVLCPYAVSLGDEVITRVERTHPVVVREGQALRSPSYAAPGLILQECDRPLSRPPADAVSLSYRDQLSAVRRFAADGARRAGLPPERVIDLVLAVSELAANTMAHTGGQGSVRLWAADGEFICQVDDAGQLADPLAGRLRPDPAAPGGNRGLWMVQQVCDLVEVRARTAGTSIRLHMRLSGVPAWR